MNWKLILAAAFVFLTCFFISWYSIRQLRKDHGGDVRVVWYLFSLTFVITYGIASWAVSNEVLNEHRFEGELGAHLEQLLKAMLNLEASLIFVLAIAGLIVLPQLISYFLSGLSGCAGTPFLIEGSLSFLVWGLVKSFAVCGGIIISLAVFGIWHDWDTWQQDSLVMTYTSSMLIMLSFTVLLMYREAETVATDIQKHFPKLYAKCLAIHLWCTRHTTSK